MSNLADRTERKAIRALAKTLRVFDQLRDLDMTASDDFDATAAQHLISGIIETNGYAVHYQTGKGTTVRKIRKAGRV